MNINLYKNKEATIGIIKLDTKFERILGDIGNPKTWKFPVIFQTMEGVFPEKVIFNSDYEVLVKAIEAAKILEERGVCGITTSCGFLGKFQKKIGDSVNIPVFTSSLLQIPLIYNLINKDKKIGILTANYKSLTEEHLINCGINDIPLIIGGMDDYSYFQSIFISNQITTSINIERLKTEFIQAAMDLKHSCNELGAIVLECTNMSPFSYDIQKGIRLPVFDINSLVEWVYNSWDKQNYIK